jgi:TPR repeat protein
MDGTGGQRAHLLSHEPDATNESSLHMASAPSDSVIRSTDTGAAPCAQPHTLHPLLTQALQIMRQGNYREAIPLLEKAAADGSAEADVELSECFGQGWGTPVSPTRALQHANRSASRGTVEGHYMVAW